MKMHNDPHSWTEFIELLHSWWRGETPMGAVLLSVVMAAMRIAYGGGGWKKMLLEDFCFQKINRRHNRKY